MAPVGGAATVLKAATFILGRAGRSPDEDEAAQAAAQELREFLKDKEGTCLRAWLKHFDLNNDQKISHMEFNRGLKIMNYPGDADTLFAILDTDKSGELSLEEVDVAQSGLWLQFRQWCVSTFDSAQDMMRKLSPKGEDHVTCEHFKQGLHKNGWDKGFEDMIFQSLDIEDRKIIGLQQVKWIEVEMRRQRRKEQARRRAALDKAKKGGQWKAAFAVLQDFKAFLKAKYGYFVRAWRQVLSPDGGMVLQRNDLFKACAAIGWRGDLRLLYKALDKDESGYISIEELDPKGAEMLAEFHDFVMTNFGSAAKGFRSLDRHNKKKIRENDFLASLRSLGYPRAAKLLFHALDLRGAKALVEEDLTFLDKWKPPAYLLSPPNPEAAEEVKVLLLKHCRTYLKAWRHTLDVDNSNHCNFDEFQAACAKIGFKGDVPGAWRALDSDLTGFICFREVDTAAFDSLANFKRWCDEEFGSVRSAFSVFDTSGDNEVSYREFRRSCRVYGFVGDVYQLFLALDAERSGVLSMGEVDFLDEWEWDSPESQDTTRPTGTAETETGKEEPRPKSPRELHMPEYFTDGPGPGWYCPPTTVGGGPLLPTVRFGGAYSLRKRPVIKLPDVHVDAADIPSPVDYDDRAGILLLSPTKPSWAFNTAKREANEVPVLEPFKPGPGAYTIPTPRGPMIACTPRRALRVHPLLRP